MKICETKAQHRREKSVFSFLGTTIGSFCSVERPNECLKPFSYCQQRKKRTFLVFARKSSPVFCSLIVELANKKRRRESVSTFLLILFSALNPSLYPKPSSSPPPPSLPPRNKNGETIFIISHLLFLKLFFMLLSNK